VKPEDSLLKIAPICFGESRQLGLACKGLSGEENDRLTSIQLLPKLLPTFLKRKLQVRDTSE
jgi:hypothetical protein